MWAEQSVDQLRWEYPIGVGVLKGYERIAKVHESRLIHYPVLTYRYYESEELKEEATVQIAMRSYYPDDFEHLVTAHGFRLCNKWGGYSDEEYGAGPELVIEFSRKH